MFIKLTRKGYTQNSGMKMVETSIYINPLHISRIYYSECDERTIIYLGSDKIRVIESVEDVLNLINK